MVKKFLIMFLTLLVGAFVVSYSMAQPATFSEIAYDLRADVVVDTNGSGTIINPEGFGDVLLFNYYDVRELNGKLQDTYFAIINISGPDPDPVRYDDVGGIAAKLRFREWKNSHEVYDVDIWLSCNDVWVGLVRQDTTKKLAYLWSPDYVITSSTINSFTVEKPLDVKSPEGILEGRPFRPSLIGLPNESSLYGYFEVIGEERTVCKTDATGKKVTRFNPQSYNVDCPNTLAGYAYIVRVNDGVGLGYNATAIANFSRNRGSLYVGPGAVKPDLTDGEETIDQLEFLLSKELIAQGFSIEESIEAKFSLVLTFPTKHFHFGESSPYNLNLNTISYSRGDRPRGEPFVGTTSNTGEPVALYIWDRDEKLFSVPPGFESPSQREEELVIPYELAIIGLYRGSGAPSLTNPRDNLGFATGSTSFDKGWFALVFGNEKVLDANDPPPTGYYGGNADITAFNYFGQTFNRYVGLPVMGLIIQEFENSLVGVGAVYGEVLPVYFWNKWVAVNGG